MARTAKLEPLKRWLEAIAALREALEEADRAESFLAESKAAIEDAAKRAEGATRQATELEGRRDRLAADVEADRQRLLAPTLKERERLVAESDKITAQTVTDKQAMEEERGRRTSILRALGEDEQQAKRQHDLALQAMRDEAEVERRTLHAGIERLRAETALAQEDRDRARGEYRAVQDAAAKLAGR